MEEWFLATAELSWGNTILLLSMVNAIALLLFLEELTKNGILVKVQIAPPSVMTPPVKDWPVPLWELSTIASVIIAVAPVPKSIHAVVFCFLLLSKKYSFVFGWLKRQLNNNSPLISKTICLIFRSFGLVFIFVNVSKANLTLIPLFIHWLPTTHRKVSEKPPDKAPH